MFNFSIKRLLQAMVVLFVVSIITFVGLKIIPGDAAELILGTDATPESLEAMRESMGLNAPLISQYLGWIGDVLLGDFGNSYYFGDSVVKLILQRLPVTLMVATISVGMAFIFSLILGVLAAVFKDSPFDYAIRIITQISSAVPSFWLGMLGMFYFSAKMGWFPVTGYIPLSEGILKSIHSVLLPCFILAIGESGILVRQFRSAMIKELEADYMLSTKMKGLRYTHAIIKYALRSAIMTPVTIASLQFAKLFGGTAVIETVFSLPGLGRLLVVSVEQRDLVLLQGIVLFITMVVVLISFFTDVLYAAVNKTIKLEVA